MIILLFDLLNAFFPVRLPVALAKNSQQLPDAGTAPE
jgi:hypothetical protein